MATIYTEKGGFNKADFYANFDIDGHKSIFSETDPASRAPRAKAVAVLFSTTNLRQGQDIIYKCVNRFVDRLQEEGKSGKPVNVLNFTRGLAVDAVSSYLLGTSYGALDENGTREEKNAVKKEVSNVSPETEEDHEMSASGMVNCFVAVGRFWYLPLWAFQWVEKFDAWWNADKEVSNSLSQVDDFVGGVVSDAEAAIAASKSNEKTSSLSHPLTSYPARMLQAGITPSETRAQCKDLIFAGTDSTGMNMGTILFNLVKHPECYKKLREEILAANPSFDDLQSLPYLRGVVKEGLRLSMANPSRLPRVVPASGWTFKGTYFPAGTVVGVQPFSLHFNPEVFENPHEFKPERWENPSEEMLRDAIPFGLGARQCIARNLATVELYCGTERIARTDALSGAKTLKDKVEILEWFNSKVVGERIDIVWK
jgi:cytochrome P450